MIEAPEGWDVAFAAERIGLVRLCRHLTGDPDTAEDLAQETLREAWRHLERLHDPAGRSRWLAAIARNVFLRWRRSRQREVAHRKPGGRRDDTRDQELLETVEDDLDLTAEIERAELAGLLGRALAFLAPDTRAVLIEHYVQDTPLAEIAQRLGVSEAAVGKRPQRGRVAFRHLLTTRLRADAAAYGLIAAEPDVWEPTQIWCAGCGQHRLLGRFADQHTRLQLRCPTCSWSPSTVGADMCLPELFRDSKTFKPAYTRLLDWCATQVRVSSTGVTPPCLRCGTPSHLVVAPTRLLAPDVRLRCVACGWRFDCTLGAHIFTLPRVRRFWRDHPRLRLLPPREVEAAEGRLLVVSFQDVTGRVQLDTLCTRGSLVVRGGHGEASPSPSAGAVHDAGAARVQ